MTENEMTAVQEHSSSFSRFTELPVELRLMIWSRTIRPRRLEVSTDWSSRYYDTPRNKVHTNFPALLRVCQESRRLGLEIYRRCSAETVRVPFYLSVFDTIHFNHYTAMLHFDICFDTSQIYSEVPPSENELAFFRNVIFKACPDSIGEQILTPKRQKLYHIHMRLRGEEGSNENQMMKHGI
ncbi:uncharacterized protein PAC_01115 [Phialocephala subalpina]|uniref:2EXR domain-containing protein n=1 Tax=Phialocephala subalpina TaxID=576137 RepID=A0A1L7WEM7_9HELO|nr:uncharacterized protein PAC_01115 [Phialocephala subalpina]